MADDLTVRRVGSKYPEEPSTDFSNKDDKKKISIFGGNDKAAYMPLGGIGSLLNGTNQPAQTAVQA